MEYLATIENIPIIERGPASAAFLHTGVLTLHDALTFVHQLPYGRNANRAEYQLVLTEGRGTCSTKHALIAALSEELGVPVVLTLGVYEMSERNTPGVGQVLALHELALLPEAHCFLRLGDHRIDVTRWVEPGEPISTFLFEETITPEQIGKYKAELHRRYLSDWSTGSPLHGRLTPDELWQIREQCIAALGEE